jgi:hypothetical protein
MTRLCLKCYRRKITKPAWFCPQCSKRNVRVRDMEPASQPTPLRPDKRRSE